MWAVGRLSLLSRRRTAKPAPATGTGTRENIAIDPQPEVDEGPRTPDVSDRQEKLNTPRVIVEASKVRETAEAVETAEPARAEPAPRVVEQPTRDKGEVPGTAADERAAERLDAPPQPIVPDPAPQGFFARVVRRVRSLFQSIFG